MNKRIFIRRVILILAVVGLGLAGTAHASVIDLTKAEKSGTVVLKGYSGQPDNHGVFETYIIQLPPFEKGVYYRGGWWPAGGNRIYGEIIDPQSIQKVQVGGIFLLLKQNPDSYLAVLPISGPIAYSWFQCFDGRFAMNMGTHGTAPIAGDIPLYSWAKAANPYQACYKAWQEALNCAQIKGRAFLREEKKYPEIFEYLGWCTWEQYHGGITEKNTVQAMKDIEKSGLPIRYVLIDDGHFSQQSIEPTQHKFPNGYKPLADMRKPDKIKWVGIWYAFLGGSHGVKAPGQLGSLSDQMFTCKAGKLLPRDNPQAARAFYEYIFDFARKYDLDFTKVDFLTDALPFYAGTPHGNPLRGLPPNNSDAIGNPLATTASLNQVFQTVVEERMKALINCNWHNAVSLFNSKTSIVGRCSEDYGKNNLGSARRHLYHSYSALPWLGQIAWGDHDMFHSNDKFAGRMMAVSKAMSGAPIYLSDAPTEFDGKAVTPLCYQDGLLLRPLAPAAPLPDSLFVDVDEKLLYKTIAPLPNKSASIVVYNLFGGVGEDEEGLNTSISPEDYSHAAGMIQPYSGKWDIPREGLVAYDWYNKKGGKLEKPLQVAIKGFGDRLIQLSPIRNGWSVIGRSDKYLSAAAVEIIDGTASKLSIKMHECGPLVIFSNTGKPKANGLTFETIGNSLYQAKMPVAKGTKLIHIRSASF